MTLALGFGRTQAQSVSVAEGSLRHPFGQTAASYLRGWVSYDAGLRPPPAREARLAGRYYLSANVLKASEDKTFPGAIVASLASPWGQSVPAGVTAGGEPSYFGSYREVFARDLYEAFTGLMADGDVSTARAATLFLFDRQQLPDGAMPRNSLLNGKAAPDTGGTQLDEAAYPILMAYLAGLGGDATLWKGHIRPAADFLVANGPSDGVERWEEQTGYSPSTIAAEIAGLTAASAIAASHGDAARARLYQATADDFQRNIKAWTVTTTGPYASRYFIRLSKTGDPNAAISYGLGNGGPTLDQRAVVDGGFQELVRLGELPVTDPDVKASLAVLDKQIAVSTPSGTGYYRYGNDAAKGSADGYGDCYQPSQTSCTTTGAPWPPTDIGTGHLWPNLSGERAESDLAAGSSSGAASLLQAMINFSSGVGLVPEQAWEDPDLAASPYGSDPATASIGFTKGKAAGSASPLTWAQAQELRLIASLGTRPQRGHPGHHHRALRHRRAAWLAAGDHHRAGPGQHAGHLVGHRDRDDRAGGSGDGRVGRHHDRRPDRGDQHDRGGRRVVLGDGAGQLRQQRDHRDRHRGRGQEHRLRPGHRHQRGRRQHRARRDRPVRRRQRARHLPVPDRRPSFHAGAFDLTRFQVLSDGTFAYLRATLRNLDPTFGQTDGAQLLDVYVHVPGAASTSTQAPFASRNYTIAPAGAWSQRVEVQGFAPPVWVNASGGSVGTASVLAEQADRTITIALPEAQFGTPGSGWGFSVVLTGQDGFSTDQARNFSRHGAAFTFGVCAPGGTAPICAVDPDTVPKAVDVITPRGRDPGHRARSHPRPRGHPAGDGALACAVRGGGPGEVRRVDAGADRVPSGVGQPDPGDELVARP